VLHIFDHSLPIRSGYTVRSAAIIREQRRRGISTAHLTSPKHPADGPSPQQIGELAFHRTPPPKGPLARSPVLGEALVIKKLAREITRIARQEKPHILHAHSPVLNGLAGLLAARRLHLPVVYEVRAFWEDAAVNLGTAHEGGPRYRLTRALETFVFRRCDAIVTICEGLKRDILARGIPGTKLEVVANGVDTDKFVPAAPDTAFKKSLGLEGRIVLGFYGSFYAYEGLDLLLTAMPEILRGCPGTVLLLAGSGPVEGALKKQAAELDLGESVRFLGSIPYEQIRAYYGSTDIFVYPRHRMRLTDIVTPLKPLEAMALGGMVLASDVGGHLELVKDGETGRLFSAGDARALAQAVQGLIADRGAWKFLGQNARAFVERERSWTTTTAPYGSLYARLVDQNSGAWHSAIGEARADFRS
jgi:PEP-CTERM/exosortase A-associated glycosyltransferase